jgi:hypothetical protein
MDLGKIDRYRTMKDSKLSDLEWKKKTEKAGMSALQLV